MEMKSTLVIMAALLLASCGGKNEKEKETGNREPAPSSTSSTAPATGKDAELTSWLSGKRLVSTAKEPQYDMWNDLKLYADGTCKDKDNASAKWRISEGKFIFEAAINMTKELEKTDDTTLVFKGLVSDQRYILKPVE